MKKNIGKIFLILVLMIIYIYIVAIDSIPNNLTRFEGEKLNINMILGLKLNSEEEKDIMQVSTNARRKKVKSSWHYKG